MDLRQLEMFKAVADLGGFTRAGEKLHVSHSAIIRQIKLLEEELHSPLFVRANKRVSLTEAGKVFLTCVVPIFDQLQKATQSVTQLSEGDRRHLHVGTGTTMLNFFLPPILESFKRRYPTVPLLIKTAHTDVIIEDMKSRTLDLAVATLPLPNEGREFSLRPLYREELVAVVGHGHPLARKKIVLPEELNKFPLIVFSKGSSTRRLLDRYFQELDITPLIQLELENDEAVERAITAGIAISFLTQKRACRDKVSYFRIANHQIFREVGLVSIRSQRPPAHLTDFTEMCCEHAKSTFGPDCLCA